MNLNQLSCHPRSRSPYRGRFVLSREHHRTLGTGLVGLFAYILCDVRTTASSLRVPALSIAEFDDHAIVIISLVRSPPISHIKDFIDAVVYGKPSLHKAWRKPVPMDS